MLALSIDANYTLSIVSNTGLKGILIACDQSVIDASNEHFLEVSIGERSITYPLLFVNGSAVVNIYDKLPEPLVPVKIAASFVNESHTSARGTHVTNEITVMHGTTRVDIENIEETINMLWRALSSIVCKINHAVWEGTAYLGFCYYPTDEEEEPASGDNDPPVNSNDS